MRPLTLACACVLLTATSASGQSDPIRCWWRTTVGAVSVGEPFDATVTCAVREQDSTRSVPDETRLAAAVVQLAPFEVLGGTHPADLRSSTHRFFQYHYTLRIIDRDMIGRDARFPDLQIPYRVHTLTSGEWMAGRDRTYTIPGHAIRVLSLVPSDASDIRDAGDSEFARVETLRFRSRAFEIGAYALTALGLIVAAPAVLALARRRRASDDVEARGVARRAVSAAAEAELTAVERDSRQGWTPDLLARALTALRIAAAAALRRDVASRRVDHQTPTAGRLIATGGFVRKQRFEVSSALTATDLRQLDAHDLAVAMTTLTAALYGRPGSQQDSAVDEAFTAARTALRQIARRA
jgi:hypothetical protein